MGLGSGHSVPSAKGPGVPAVSPPPPACRGRPSPVGARRSVPRGGSIAGLCPAGGAAQRRVLGILSALNEIAVQSVRDLRNQNLCGSVWVSTAGPSPGDSCPQRLPPVSISDCDIRVHRPAGLHLLFRPGSLAVGQASEAAAVLPAPRYGRAQALQTGSRALGRAFLPVSLKALSWGWPGPVGPLPRGFRRTAGGEPALRLQSGISSAFL